MKAAAAAAKYPQRKMLLGWEYHKKWEMDELITIVEGTGMPLDKGKLEKLLFVHETS